MITKYSFANERSFYDYAKAFAARLRAGDVVALSGPLGSGKTTFVRAVVEALHGDDQTSSPTFTFWHRYAGDPPIDHVDLFRLGARGDRSELGLEAAFDDPTSIVMVEWWQNAPDLLADRRYEIEIEGAGDSARTLRVKEPA
jgi:tRNA threonylcarbamoyladenosine biosynthesis protein TsaE